jgi:hypothetical protein
MVGALVLPRAVPPEAIPLPRVDARALAATEGADHGLAQAARRDGLAPDLRVLGTAIRDFNILHTLEATTSEITKARAAVDKAVPEALAATGAAGLVALRAVQTEAFLDELRRYEASGEESDELKALAGAFIARISDAGWTDGHKVLMDPSQRRVAFKLAWNTSIQLEHDPALAPTRDELRVLYTFYLMHPHVGETARIAFAAARAAVHDPQLCETISGHERAAIEDWRLDKVRRLGQIDPDYPTAYAVGVVQWKRGAYGESAKAFQDFLSARPSGPLSLRARNHELAALAADRDF